MKRDQWRAVLFAVLLFCCGGGAGVLGDRYYMSTAVEAKTAEDFRHQYMAEMKSKLNLNERQMRDLETILDETKARYKAVRDSCRPALVKIKQQQVERVKSILSPDQVPVYDRLVAERERRAKQQEERERREELARAAAKNRANPH